MRRVLRQLVLFAFFGALTGLAVQAISIGGPSPMDLVVPCYGGSCEQYGASEVGALPYGDFRDSLLPTLTRILIYTMVSVAVFMFITAAMMLFTGFGEEEGMTKAKHIIIWSIVGMGFAAAAYLLVSAVLKFDYGS